MPISPINNRPAQATHTPARTSNTPSISSTNGSAKSGATTEAATTGSAGAPTGQQVQQQKPPASAPPDWHQDQLGKPKAPSQEPSSGNAVFKSKDDVAAMNARRNSVYGARPSGSSGRAAATAQTSPSSARAGAHSPAAPAPAASRNSETPASGQPPRKLNDALAAEIAQYHYDPAQPNDRKRMNSQADYGVVHPDLPGIRTRLPSVPMENQPIRGEGFADFTRDARVSTHRLMEGQTGHAMLTELNNSTERLNPGATGTQKVPLTAVDIRESNRMSHHPRLDPNLTSDAAIFADAQQAYRFNGQPSAGKASNINYNPQGGKTNPQDTATQVGDNRANSLGHEMTHAWRAAHGVAVAPLESSKHAQHPTLQRYNNPDGTNLPKAVISHHNLLKEEFETVGLQPTPGRPNAPSENKIRRELGMPPRTDYSGEGPNGQTEEALARIDAGTDNRTFFQKHEKSPFYRPSDVQKIVSDLEK
ncbi:hypothetical protein CYFUS_001722 [Cystobacter fuscus]|uniref:Uncharacterized protein n=1 Tax=Cystobacter fuscus TaxID=43 RepID=A0A250IYJ0_9BACT|nr:M91 family zinc metallopeptidase [Cystobacter fuscus]ATB36308.1 hypothetical protein CYFUS_001722 [Cystobacter fuscus]